MAAEYLTSNPAAAIDQTVAALDCDKVVIVTDSNVEKLVLPSLIESQTVKNSPRIAITPGEEGKNLDTVVEIWNVLEKSGATRHSVVLNIGGGVVTDIGGFAAATFKRGVRTVNFPTTLLSAVDAATGGKTGINFNGLKNEIGAFHIPSKVIISVEPFRSLSNEELLSGYAEMVKTALISDARLYFSLLEFEDIVADKAAFGQMVEKCVAIKDDVVAQDPKEKGLRKILNFGHTAGHSFESLRFESGRPVSHGKAVAHGMLVALILSGLKLGFPSKEIHVYSQFLKNHYGPALITCEEVDNIMEKMSGDKKNRRHGEPSFTLLKEIGNPEIDCYPSKNEISESLEIYLDLAR